MDLQGFAIVIWMAVSDVALSSYCSDVLGLLL